MRPRVPKRELDLLARVPLFSQCARGELREIARLGTEVDVNAGTVLTKEGGPGSEFFLLLEGHANCAVRGTTVADLGPGDFFGELALLDGRERTATITATTPLRVSVLNRAEFRTALGASPSISLKLLSTLAGRLRETQARATY